MELQPKIIHISDKYIDKIAAKKIQFEYVINNLKAQVLQ